MLNLPNVNIHAEDRHFYKKMCYEARFWNVLSCMAAEISSFSVTFYIKFNLVYWWNTSINVALFHPRQFSFYKATHFPFILKLIIKYGSHKTCSLNFELVKYSSKFQPSVFRLTYRGIIERRIHNILNFSPYFSTTSSTVDRDNSELFTKNS